MFGINEELSELGKKEIADLHSCVAEYLRLINQAVIGENTDILNTAYTKGSTITHLVKKYRASHLDRVAAGDTSPLKSLIFTDILNSYRRIKDHTLNIAEVFGGEK